MSDLDAAIRDIAERDYRDDPIVGRGRADLLAALNIPTSEAYTALGTQVNATYWQYRTAAERDRFRRIPDDEPQPRNFVADDEWQGQ
jgi:hypothetical protein